MTSSGDLWFEFMPGAENWANHSALTGVTGITAADALSILTTEWYIGNIPGNFLFINSGDDLHFIYSEDFLVFEGFISADGSFSQATMFEIPEWQYYQLPYEPGGGGGGGEASYMGGGGFSFSDYGWGWGGGGGRPTVTVSEAYDIQYY